MNWIRAQDIVWLALFSALAWASPHSRSAVEIVLLLSLGVFQIVEPRIVFFANGRGVLASLGLKLVLCYLLIGWTGGISSSYYITLLLPVISAATRLRLGGAIAMIVASILAYLSFLLFIDWRQLEFSDTGARELVLRVLFFPAIGLLTWQLAEANRTQASKAQAAAQKLEEAIRDLHAAEDAVRRSDRLAALGQLTAGLAHELRNPLATIRGSADVLRRKFNGSEPVLGEMSEFITSEVERANSLITRFLEFARPMQLRLSPVSLGALLDAAVAEVRRSQDAQGVSIYLNYAPDIPPLLVDAELMSRVFYNLVLNAVQATGEQGTVTVKTRRAPGGAEIAVIDRGSGISPSDRQNIFNPFFTTKPSGVGLGLAIVNKMVDEHGGSIEVESEPGTGSVFRVFLPAVPVAESTR